MEVTLTHGGQVCGTLLTDTATGTPRIRRAADGIVVDIPVREITGIGVVAGCLRWEHELPCPAACQVVTDGGNGDCGVPRWLMIRVKVRVSGMVQADEFEVRI